MTCVCYSSWSSSQFHVEIYDYYAEEFQVYKTDLWYQVLFYLWIQLSSLMIFTVSWTVGLPCITDLFSTFPFKVLLFSQCIYLTLSISFWYDVLLNAVCLNLLHNLILVCHFVHMLWHTMYVIYMYYIYETYTLVSTVSN